MLNSGGYLTMARRRSLPGAALFAAMLVAGCSGSGMFSSDNSPLPLPPPLEAGADGVVADNTGRNATAAAGADDTAAADTSSDTSVDTGLGTGNANALGDAEYPDLADVPEGAAATKTAENAPEAQAEREKLANELVADRERAKYTDEELRGGRVPAVAPPRPQPPAPPRPAGSSPMTEATIETPSVAAAPQKPVTQARPEALSPPPLPPAGLTPAPAPAPVSAAAPTRAAIAPQPVQPQKPRAVAPAAAATQTPSYSSSTFQPSTAQPLPPDLVASLPPGVAQRYQETLRRPLSGAPSALPVTPVIGRGGAAFASIPFASGSSQLSAADQRTIRQAAEAAIAQGGIVRVVGHASSTAGSQSESQRMLANWEVSQARATAVADALVRQGMDASQLIIEALGDSQTGAMGGYADEAAGRRVDLFLE